MTTPVRLHPSEIRLRTGKAGRDRAILVALGAVVSLVCFAGLLLVAGSLRSTPNPRQPSEIKFGKIEWPEIKNGVPELVRTHPPASGTSVSSSLSSPEPTVSELPNSEKGAPAAEPLAPVPNGQSIAEEDMASAEAVMAQLRSSEPMPSPEVDPNAFAPDLVASSSTEWDSDGAQVAAPTKATLSSPADPSGEAFNVDETSAILPLSVPLPPRRPKEANAPPRPKRAGVVERRSTPQAATETRVIAAEPLDLEAPRAETEDERANLLGLPLPSFIPSGRKIKECVLEFRC
jgi:hypothetical protein